MTGTCTFFLTLCSFATCLLQNKLFQDEKLERKINAAGVQSGSVAEQVPSTRVCIQSLGTQTINHPEKGMMQLYAVA